MNKFDDIINIEHYEPKHPRMSIYERSAQFAPFAALTGYSDQVNEVSRYTDNEIFIDEDFKYILNKKMEMLKTHLELKPLVKVIYFVPDKIKNGGVYKEFEGKLNKILINEQKLVFLDNVCIDIKNIINIESNVISLY